MIGTGNGSRILRKTLVTKNDIGGKRRMQSEDLRARTQLLSLREQLEHNHFLLERLYAASAGILQAVEDGDVHVAIGEIVSNLIGSEEAAIFHYHKAVQRFVNAWSVGISDELLRRLSDGTGMMWRTVGEGVTQFRDRQTGLQLQSCEQNLTASVVLKSGHEIVGVLLIFNLLPQKNGLEWVDHQLFKFLETFGAVAIQLQRLRENSVRP
jgi:hypothetical protein